MRRPSWRWTAWLLTGVLLGSACSDSNENGSPGAADGGGPTSGGDNTGRGADGDSEPPLPPEEEIELSFERPAVGRRRVYALNPESDRVAVVDAESFAIESIEVGDQPDFAVTAPGRDLAVVLNVGSQSVSILTTEKGKTSSTEVPIDVQANRLVMSPDGAHALAYFDTRAGEGQASSFQDVAVIDVADETPQASLVTVGFRPYRVQFADDGARAYVITEDGISVIDLTRATEEDGTIARLVRTGDAVDDPASSDVSVTSNGRHALARQQGNSELRLVEMASGDVTVLDLAALPLIPDDDGSTEDGGPGDAGIEDAGAGDASAADAGASDAGDAATFADGGDAAVGEPVLDGVVVTDVDLSHDGTFALAVVRSHDALVKLPIPEAFEDPAQAQVISLLKAPLVGSVVVARDGSLAVAYTTASEDVESVTLVDLQPPFAERNVRLRKAVRAVALSDDAERLLVLHEPRGGPKAPDTSDEDDRIDRSQGYSVVDVPNLFAKLQLTEALVSSQGGFAITPSTSHLFVIVRNDERGVRQLQQVDLSNLAVETIPLSAPPTTLGLVPEVRRAVVGQELSGGMMTFVDYARGSVQTVTGFELSSRIRQ